MLESHLPERSSDHAFNKLPLPIVSSGHFVSGLLTDTQRDLIALVGLTPLIAQLVRLARVIAARYKLKSGVVLTLTPGPRLGDVLAEYNRESDGDITVLRWLGTAALVWTTLGAVIGAAFPFLLNAYAGISTVLVGAQFFALVYIYWGFDAWAKEVWPAPVYQRYVIFASAGWLAVGGISLLFLAKAHYTFDEGPALVGVGMQCMYGFLATVVVTSRDVLRAVARLYRRPMAK